MSVNRVIVIVVRCGDVVDHVSQLAADDDVSVSQGGRDVNHCFNVRWNRVGLGGVGDGGLLQNAGGGDWGVTEGGDGLQQGLVEGCDKVLEVVLESLVSLVQ